MNSKYNGGLTREQFLFYEIRVLAGLLNDGLSEEEAVQEASRCLRCDKHGCGMLRGGRQDRW